MCSFDAMHKESFRFTTYSGATASTKVIKTRSNVLNPNVAQLTLFLLGEGELLQVLLVDIFAAIMTRISRRVANRPHYY